MNRTLSDWVGGVTYSQYLKNQSFIRAGLSVGNITGRNQSFADANDRIKLTPQVFYQRKGNNQELLTQAKVGYLLDEAKGIFVNGGLGYRWGDSFNILLGADIKDVRIQFAYDINANGLIPATNTVGGFELGVSYIGKVYKKPKVDPTQVCPRF